MDFRDTDGAPLVKWTDRGGRIRGAGRRAAAGRPCDYSGMSYAKLPGARRHPVAVQRQLPDGPRAPVRGRRLQHRRPTTARRTATTSRPARRSRPRSTRPGIRRDAPIIKGAEYLPPPEEPDADYPVPPDHGPGHPPLPHAHQDRPGARRSTPPRRAAFVEISDDGRRGCSAISDGDLVEVRSRRGKRRRAGTAGRGRAGRRVHAVPLRRRGDDDEADGGQPADDHRLGPGQQAAALQVRGRGGVAGAYAAATPAG